MQYQNIDIPKMKQITGHFWNSFFLTCFKWDTEEGARGIDDKVTVWTISSVPIQSDKWGQIKPVILGVLHCMKNWRWPNECFYFLLDSIYFIMATSEAKVNQNFWNWWIKDRFSVFLKSERNKKKTNVILEYSVFIATNNCCTVKKYLGHDAQLYRYSDSIARAIQAYLYPCLPNVNMNIWIEDTDFCSAVLVLSYLKHTIFSSNGVFFGGGRFLFIFNWNTLGL